MSFPEPYKSLPGYKTSYGDTELASAIALKEIGIGGGGSGGSGGATGAEIKTAIEAATNLNDVENNQAIANTKLTLIDNKQDALINLIKGWKLLNSYDLTANSVTQTFSIDTIAESCNTYAVVLRGDITSGNIIIFGTLNNNQETYEEIEVYRVGTKIFTGNTIADADIYLCRCNSPFFRLQTSNPFELYNQILTLEIYKYPAHLYDNLVTKYNLAVSAAEQAITNQTLAYLNTNLGDKTDSIATADNDETSLLSLFKRLLSIKLGENITGTTIPTGGGGILGLLSWLIKLFSDRLPSALANDRLKTQTVLDSITITGSANATDGLVIPSTDCSNYTFLSLQLTGTWSGIVIFEFSNNNINWISGILYNLNSTGTPNTVTTSNSIYYGNKQGRYFRARLSTYSSGTASGTLSLSSSPTTPAYPITAIAGTPTFNLASNSVDTELPAAVNFADNLFFNASPSVWSGCYLWNNSTGGWDRARTSGSGRALVDGSGVTQPISATSLPLPSGAATETTLSNFNAKFPTSVNISDTLSRSPNSIMLGAINLFDNGTNFVRGRVTTATSGVGLGRQAIASGTEVLTLLSGITAPSTGTSIALTSGYKTITAQLIATVGNVSTINCNIEGSLNGTNWFTLAALTDNTNGAQVSSDGKVFTFVRANLTAITGGATISILASAVA